MKALTIVQPFAHLIAAGAKRVENRSWPTSHRGPLAIHAGKARTYNGESVADLARDDDIDPAKLAFGAVVAVVDLVDCVELISGGIDRDRTPAWAMQKYPWLDGHVHREGPVCWVLANLRRLADPIQVKGAQGLWDWTPPGELVYADHVEVPTGCCALAVAVLKGVPGIGPNGTEYYEFGKGPDEVASDLRRESEKRASVVADIRRRLRRAMPGHYPSALVNFAEWLGVSWRDIDPDLDQSERIADAAVPLGPTAPIQPPLFSERLGNW